MVVNAPHRADCSPSLGVFLSETSKRVIYASSNRERAGYSPMADDPARDARAGRVRRPPQHPVQPPSRAGAVPRAGERPTADERQEAQRVLDALHAVGLLRGKSTHVPVELIALARAWRRKDPAVAALDDVSCLTLFEVRLDGNRDWRRKWAVDVELRRIEQAEQYLALSEEDRAAFVPDRPSRDEVEARKRQRAECAYPLACCCPPCCCLLDCPVSPSRRRARRHARRCGTRVRTQATAASRRTRSGTRGARGGAST